MNNRQINVTDLAIYLVRRYFKAGCKADDDKFVANIRRALVRMEKEITVGKTTLYDLHKEHGSVRTLSVSEFEFYLFGRWYVYMKRKHADEYSETLEEDHYRILGIKNYDFEDQYWENKAQEIAEGIDHDIRNNPDLNTDVNGPVVTDAELRQRGMELMIQGLFEQAYGQFNWSQLRADMELAQSIPYTPNPEVTKDMARAYINQYKYENYIIPIG